MSLTALHQQGHGHRQLIHQSLTLRKEPALAKNICINTSSTVNPDQDIVSTGNYHIQQDQLDSDLASIHSPAGAFLGAINIGRLNTLDQAYWQITSGTFAGAVASLLTRYKNSGPTEETRRTEMSNHWATPDELMPGLISCLDLKIEWFASPLNFHTGMDTYFAANQEDATFGANVEAYSTPCLGASQASPEYELAEMEKTVRWAVMSAAHTEEASMTAFILPDWARTLYYKYMVDPRVQRAAKIPISGSRHLTSGRQVKTLQAILSGTSTYLRRPMQQGRASTTPTLCSRPCSKLCQAFLCPTCQAGPTCSAN